jgi:hypothetical protein
MHGWDGTSAEFAKDVWVGECLATDGKDAASFFDGGLDAVHG